MSKLAVRITLVADGRTYEGELDHAVAFSRPSQHAEQSLNASRYVRVNAFCAMTGFSVKACNRKREIGAWLEGEVWHKIGASVLYDIDGFYRWVERSKRSS